MNYKLFFYFLLLSRLLQTAPLYEVYIESYYPCNGTAACGAYFPSCHFAFGPNIIGTVCFARLFADNSHPLGTLWGLQGTKDNLTQTISLIHQVGGKVKLCYGGARTQAGQTTYQIWGTPGWDTESVQDMLAQNVAAVVEKFGFDGVDFDFEDGPPPGAGAATANVIKLVRQYLNEKGLKNSILTLTLPSQILYGKIGNYDPNSPNKNPYTNPIPSQRSWIKVNPGDSQSVYPEAHAILDNLCDESTGLIDFSIINYVNWMEYCNWIAPGSTIDQQAIADVTSYHEGFYKIPFENMAVEMSCGASANVNYSPSQAANVTKWVQQNTLAGVFFWSMNQEVNYNLPNFCNTNIPSGTSENKIMSVVFKDSLAIITALESPTQIVSSPVAIRKRISNGSRSVTPGFNSAQRATNGIPSPEPPSPIEP